MGWIKEMPIPELVDTPERMLQVCREIRDTGVCAVDTETTGLNLMKDYVLFWSLAPSLDVRYCLTPPMLPIFSKELGHNPDLLWIMTNANYDNNILANSGVPLLSGNIHCTLVMDWLHDENRLGRHGLKETAKDHIGLNMKQFKAVFDRRPHETYQDTLMRMWETNQVDAIDYASMDAWASLAVYRNLKKRLMEERTIGDLRLWDIFVNIEAPYTKVLYHCIRRGIRIDPEYLETCRKPIEKDLARISKNITKIAGREINPLSPKDLNKIFFGELGYIPVKWTKGGESGEKKPSLDEFTLKTFSANGDELSNLILRYRSLNKVKSTYIDGLLKQVDSDNRIHSSLSQHITVTGRLSSSNPNLHNIPRPDEDAYQLRRAFIPKEGCVLVAADYAQLEMRLLAICSGDNNMQEVIRSGKDIHMGTAALMNSIPYEEMVEAKKVAGQLEKEKIPRNKWPERIDFLMKKRQAAKAIGFGQLRGRTKTCSKRGNLSASA